jgi:hypothetical protein
MRRNGGCHGIVRQVHAGGTDAVCGKAAVRIRGRMRGPATATAQVTIIAIHRNFPGRPGPGQA